MCTRAMYRRRRKCAIGLGGKEAVLRDGSCSRQLPRWSEEDEGSRLSCLKKMRAKVDPVAEPTGKSQCVVKHVHAHSRRTIFVLGVSIRTPDGEDANLLGLLARSPAALVPLL